MSLSRYQVKDKVVHSADKYGSTNPQQLKQLRLVLDKCEKEELFEGLYSVFLEENENYFQRQQLAGNLLYSLKPRLRLKLYDVIKNCLNTYNLSIEELPWYLSELCGRNRVLEVIDKISSEELSDREIESLNTFKFWLRGNNG